MIGFVCAFVPTGKIVVSTTTIRPDCKTIIPNTFVYFVRIIPPPFMLYPFYFVERCNFRQGIRSKDTYTKTHIIV